MAMYLSDGLCVVIVMNAPDTYQLLEESAPVAVILTFWAVPASLVSNTPSETGLLLAGITMALLYVGSRGLALRRDCEPSERPTDWDETLQENARVALPAGVWFLAAFVLVWIGRQLLLLTYRVTGLYVVDVVPVEAFAFALAGAGLAVVLLYAIAIGFPDEWDGVPTGETPAGTGDDD